MEQAVGLWPCNLPAVELFGQLRTQWRCNMEGPTGLDYGPAFALMDRRGLTAPAWSELFEDLQILEAEALHVMAEAARERADRARRN